MSEQRNSGLKRKDDIYEARCHNSGDRRIETKIG
jgi:hypothetical protein